MHIQKGTVSDVSAGGKDLGGCWETGKIACKKRKWEGALGDGNRDRQRDNGR